MDHYIPSQCIVCMWTFCSNTPKMKISKFEIENCGKKWPITLGLFGLFVWSAALWTIHCAWMWSNVIRFNVQIYSQELKRNGRFFLSSCPIQFNGKRITSGSVSISIIANAMQSLSSMQYEYIDWEHFGAFGYVHIFPERSQNKFIFAINALWSSITHRITNGITVFRVTGEWKFNNFQWIAIATSRQCYTIPIPDADAYTM